jgi:hypothetical protein
MEKFHLEKMKVKNSDQVQYYLRGENENDLHLNPLIGKKIKIEFVGDITCVECGKKTKKSWGEGYCFPCTQKLAECDICMVKPELCHFANGTCRQPDWGEKNCFIPHYIYLANSSGLKVGITRETNLPSRWMDQGATEAVEFLQVDNRLKSGLLETHISQFVKDKTDWRKMLKGEPVAVDLIDEAKKMIALVQEKIGDHSAKILDLKINKFLYPVLKYPEKVTSLNLEKSPTQEGVLLGIKGQYLILDIGVLNIRKHSGYWVNLNWES